MEKSKQIEILKQVLDLLINKECSRGLCFILRRRLQEHLRIYYTPIIIVDYIPLFTNQNAIDYANGRREMYWWDEITYDFDNRIKFIKWIITELEK